MGAALGLVITGVLFTASGGGSATPLRADHAFMVTAIVLAGLAAATDVQTSVRPNGTVSIRTPT